MTAVLVPPSLDLVCPPTSWLMLSYHVPRSPSAPYMTAYRRLKSLRALSLNVGLAALPDTPWAELDLRAAAAQINAIPGATASLLRVSALDGADHLIDSYNADRNAEYDAVIAECGAFLTVKAPATKDALKVRRQLAKTSQRLDSIRDRDQFGASRQAAASRALAQCRSALLSVLLR